MPSRGIAELIERLPVGQRLARMVDGRFEIDQRLVDQAGHARRISARSDPRPDPCRRQTNECRAHRNRRPVPARLRAHARPRAPSITTPSRVSICQVPLPGVITNEAPPSRAMPLWNEASVRSDGFMNSSPSTLPANACGSGRASSRRASSSKREQLVARKIRQIDEPPHGRLQAPMSSSASRSSSTCGCFEHEGRQQPQDARIGAGAGEDAALEQRGVDLLRRPAGAKSDQQPRTLMRNHRSDQTAAADQRRDGCERARADARTRSPQ